MKFTRNENEKKRRACKPHSYRVINKVVLLMARALVALVLIGGFSMAAMLIGAYLGILDKAPEIAIVNVPQGNFTSFVYLESTGEEIDRFEATEEGNRIYATIDQIPDDLEHAFVSIEDERFYDHNGVDVPGMIRALSVAITSEGTEGASTITQQLIKNERGLLRNELETKLQEQKMAIDYESELTESFDGDKARAKDYILELYLNMIGLGDNQKGVQAAANHYFGKDVSQLTLPESCVIAAITQRPTYYRPSKNPENNSERASIILGYMFEQGYIDKAEFEEAKGELLMGFMLRDDEFLLENGFLNNEEIEAELDMEESEKSGKRNYKLLEVPEKNAVLKRYALEQGYIQPFEANDTAFVYTDVYSGMGTVIEESTASMHSFYVEAARDQIIADLQEKLGYTETQAWSAIHNGGLSIYLAMDTRAQAIVDKNFLDDANFPDNEYSISIELIAYVKNNVTGQVDTMSDKSTASSKEAADAWVDETLTMFMGLEKEVVDYQVNYVVQPQGAMVIMDQHTGYVVAMAGARGEKQTNSAFNRAVDAERQPGSVYKVIASYLPAIDSGLITAASVIDDVPYSVGDYSPNNWDKSNPFKGLVSVREAIYNSMNICSLKTLEKVGIDRSFDYQEQLGFSTLVPEDLNMAAALGGLHYGVTTMDTTAAFATIANDGMYTKPILYTRVLDHEGNVLLDNTTPEQHRVIRPTSSYILTDLMKDVIRVGTGGAARIPSGMPVAGKTGTAQDDKTYYFAGYTPYYTSAIWIGHDIQKGMVGYGRVHTMLWSKIMAELHEGLEIIDFERPEGITTASVCIRSGQIPVAGVCDHDPRGSMVRTEIFEVGTQPTEYCEVHRAYEVCVESGQIPTEFCPVEVVTEGEETISGVVRKVGLVRPVPYNGTNAGSISDKRYEVPQAVLQGITCELHTTAQPSESPLPSETDPVTGEVIPPTEDPNGDPFTNPLDPSAEPSGNPSAEPSASPSPEPSEGPNISDTGLVIPNQSPSPTPEPTDSSGQ